MNCPSCQHGNNHTARFCEACGAKLERSCTNCGGDMSSEARFCPSCGTAVASNIPNDAAVLRTVADYTPKHLADKILQSRSALEGESKQVTVMFVDVKDSMVLSAQLGAEAWHTILDQFFAILSEGVHRYEGTINQYTGDGIMALFGAPIAHEDHARRACYASIRLRGQLKEFADRLRIERGIDFAVRIGINSGDVVVGKIGDDLRMDYTAQGHTVGLAQRIEQLAASGRIYLSEHTHHLVEGFFTVIDLGVSKIAGVDHPVGIFELDEASASRTRLEVARTRGLTRFVGRTDEMQALESAFNRARDGHGQVVGIVGDAGLGKSRLCYEFVERCRADGILVVDSHCPAHGKNIPLIPILELFRSFYGITQQDLAEDARRKIAGALVLLDPSLQDALPVLFDFLGVTDPAQPPLEFDPDARQARLFLLLRQVYRLLAERGTAAVIYVDDMHWIDPLSDRFITQIVEAVAEHSRMLLLLNFRPEYSAEWMRSAHYLQLPLVPLGIDAIQELVESLLGQDESVVNLADRIIRWTTGNPFYTEEVINELVEAGHLKGTSGGYRLTTHLDHLDVPANVQSVLAARIDRLPGSAKQLLQAAAVIGKEFPEAVVEAIAEIPKTAFAGDIERLKSSDFIFETALHPDIEYAFKHPLTHEIAYNSLLQVSREKLHAATASVIEFRAADSIEERSPLLAYHWEAASEPGQAIKWHQRAAQWSEFTDAAGGLHHWQRVRDLAPQLGSDKGTSAVGANACSHILGVSWRLGSSQAVIERNFEEGKALAEQAGDMVILANLFGAYGATVGVNLGNANDYVKFAEEAVRYAAMTDDEELLFAMQCAYLNPAYTEAGQWAKVLELAQGAVGLLERDDLYGSSITGSSPRLIAISGMALALMVMGRVEEALAVSKRIDSARAVEQYQESAIYWQFSEVHTAHLYARVNDAMKGAQRLAGTLESVKTNIAQVIINCAIGEASLTEGDNDRATGFFREGIRVGEDNDSGGWFVGPALGHLAESLFGQGEFDEARRRAEQAVEYCRVRGIKVDLQPWLSLVRTRIHAGDESGALAAINELQQIVDDGSAIIYQPRIHECRAEFAIKFESEWSREDELNEACRLFTELGADGHVERLKKDL